MSIRFKRFVIITGASKGLGKALAINMADDQTVFLLISRSIEALNEVKLECNLKGATVYYLATDLSLLSYQNDFKKILYEIDLSGVGSVYLFNNASIIDPIAHLINIEIEEQLTHLNLNILTAVWLTSEILRFSKSSQIPDTYIINISSGVSQKPVVGWSLYCISKAAINMLTACVCEETKNSNSSVLTVAINPGPLDTNMQKVIREADVNQSPIVDKFRNMYVQKNLKKPSDVAHRIIELLSKSPFPNGQYIDFNINV